ncbi:MAG: DUF2089 family protein [Spirochaetaceae bacterium]|jgi:hypothetical protein|nr:DUF2089 family protein [Spirochaetaceae bacterium]
MKHEWQTLMNMIRGRAFTIKQVYIPSLEIHIDGEFDLPPLMKLDSDDQVFVARFIKASGSIKEMEKQFAISYPTVKNRLKKIADLLGGVDIQMETGESRMSILEKLDKGEISMDQAMEELK